MWQVIYDQQLRRTGNLIVDNGLSVVACDAETGKVCGAFLGVDSQKMYGTSFGEICSLVGLIWNAWKVVGINLKHMGDVDEKLNIEME